jgi:protein associated with RNAse G/E
MNDNPMTIIVNSRKYDGTITRSWNADLASVRPHFLKLLGRFEADIEHPNLGLIKEGTISHEYFWTDRWYNVFRFHEPTGELRNYYLNLTMPPTYSKGVLDYVDLDIDILVWPDGRCDVLDQEDFEKNAQKFGYPDEVKRKVDLELETLLTMAWRDELPRLDP